MNKVALLIIFNHNFEKNIERLESIYGNRFSNIFYVMPFYTGNRKDVITVYENSYYFQGYLNRAIDQIFDEIYDHYFIIGDDLILNPKIDEKNYKSFFSLNEESGFIPNLFLLNDPAKKEPHRLFAPFWYHFYNILAFKTQKEGIEAKAFLPDADEAEKLISRHDMKFTSNMPRKMFFRKPIWKFSFKRIELINNLRNIKLIFYHNILLIINPKKIPYPLVGSYSDCVIIPKRGARQFSRYCGIFAALDLFVEAAIPTALTFSVDKIIQEKDLENKGLTFWLQHESIEFLTAYDFSLTKLEDNFPANTLYIHPVKLSKMTK
ncbi:hypothetical protein [Pedobacter sp. Leaf250]|uniref:hypothetical protein n=1 Tax=Pedobacter sp. Leaf250 TaxID=2876559 RepID=UPI001E632FB2|nr:hypothetical protein [Pedobacter sp. Leaf250]